MHILGHAGEQHTTTSSALTHQLSAPIMAVTVTLAALGLVYLLIRYLHKPMSETAITSKEKEN